MTKIVSLRNQTQKLRLRCPRCRGETQAFKGHEVEMICGECQINDRVYQPLDVIGVVPEKDWR